MSDRGFISAGWWGYFASASVYVIASLRAGDWLGLLAAGFFFVATICFMIPHYFSKENRGEGSDV